MALLSFVDSVPRAYRLKAGNAYFTFSTSTGTLPERRDRLFNERRALDLGMPRNRADDRPIAGVGDAA
jgi:hypothetical protein